MPVTTPTIEVQSDQRQQEFIAAIHAVINADRILTEQELLVTTACELLVDGALDTPEIVRQVNTIWAGASIPGSHVVAALQTAVKAGLMITAQSRGGSTWSLTPAGRVGAGGARDWTDEAYARTGRQLQELATKDFRPVSDVEARLWVDLLAQSLSDGTREAYAAFIGDVALLVDGTLLPKAFDSSVAFRAIRAAQLDEGTTEFLEAAVLGALDRTDPFGNDLVSHIATGCVLLAFLAGCDRADVRARLQDLAGEEFLLDTPALVLFAGSAQDAEPITRAIEATLSGGGKVIVAEHSIEEFVELVEAIGAEHIPALTQALREGLNARAYCTTVDSRLLETWVGALDEGRYRSWDDFVREAHRIKQRLAAIGVDVRPHGNYVSETVAACIDKLGEELSERNSYRKKAAIERDANTMAMVIRHRAKRKGDRSLWPGAWIVTTDRHIGPAYSRVSTDTAPAVLTVTQWAVLVMSCRQSATAKDLATVTAPLVRYQAALAIAARYPAEVALEIAKVLAPGEGPASTDLRLAQLKPVSIPSMDSVLDPETGLPAGMTPLSLASDLLARRQMRMDAVRVIQTTHAEEERLRAQARAVRAEQVAERERYAREQVERQLKDRTDNVAGLEDELADARRKTDEERQLGRRKGWLGGILVACTCLFVFSLVAGLHILAGATAVTSLVIWKQGTEWIKDSQRSAKGVLLATLTESVGLIQIFVHW